MKELFNKEAIMEVKTKAKEKAEKVKKWAEENPEAALYATLGILSTAIFGGSLASIHVSNKCEKQRTKAYVDYLNRQ